MAIKTPTILWKPVHGFERWYLISSTGTIISLHNRSFGRIVKARIDRAHYYTVRLSKEGNSYTKYVHRLLAEAFIPNPLAKSFVNHLNGDQLDNRLINLEWVTHQENILHAYKNCLIDKNPKPIIDNCSGKIFTSSKEACKYYEIKHNTLRNYLNGGIKHNPTCLQYMTAA